MIDRFVDLEQVRRDLALFYSSIGRPSIADHPHAPDRLLFGIRSERRLCDQVHLNLAYRWFCRLGLDGRCQIIRHSPRTGIGASGRATSSVACSRACCAAASRNDWSAAKDLQSMRA
ncbi:transposase [Bradyrhizobium sp. 8-10B]|uniref:transposase n=1 Tax=Bradyrhizobium sp. 8-10B TaxID=3344579 RepID=UPI0035C1766C